MLNSITLCKIIQTQRNYFIIINKIYIYDIFIFMYLFKLISGVSRTKSTDIIITKCCYGDAYRFDFLKLSLAIWTSEA